MKAFRLWHHTHTQSRTTKSENKFHAAYKTFVNLCNKYVAESYKTMHCNDQYGTKSKNKLAELLEF